MSVSSAAPVVHVLHPGDVVLAVQGERLETLLGSCVAVVLTDPRRTIGAMCHIVHSGTPTSTRHQDRSYAMHAMRAMFERIREVGIAPERCDAFIFGGGNMFPQIFDRHHVGAANVRWVREFLDQHGIAVMAESVGDDCYRKIGWTVGASDLEMESVPIDFEVDQLTAIAAD